MDGWPRPSSLVRFYVPQCAYIQLSHAGQGGQCRHTTYWYDGLGYLWYSSLTRMQLYFQDDLTLVRSWYVNGKHYGRTSEDWLKIQDSNKKSGLAELEADAVAKGLSKEEGRKAFFRCVSCPMSVSRCLIYSALTQIPRVLLGCRRILRIEWR